MVFLWAKKIQRKSDSLYKMHPVYGDKCFTKHTVHVWCKKMLGGQKLVSYTEVQSVILK